MNSSLLLSFMRGILSISLSTSLHHNSFVSTTFHPRKPVNPSESSQYFIPGIPSMSRQWRRIWYKKVKHVADCLRREGGILSSPFLDHLTSPSSKKNTAQHAAEWIPSSLGVSFIARQLKTIFLEVMNYSVVDSNIIKNLFGNGIAASFFNAITSQEPHVLFYWNSCGSRATQVADPPSREWRGAKWLGTKKNRGTLVQKCVERWSSDSKWCEK